MTLLAVLLIFLLVMIPVALMAYDAGYSDGWIDHSEGRADVRKLWKRNP